MANLPIGQFEQRQELSMLVTCVRNESGCDIYSSSWLWQAQDAVTATSTSPHTLNRRIPILVNTGFSKRTKATMSHFIVALPTAAPFANPSNSNMWAIGGQGFLISSCF
jgi:hypothetical protein